MRILQKEISGFSVGNITFLLLFSFFYLSYYLDTITSNNFGQYILIILAIFISVLAFREQKININILALLFATLIFLTIGLISLSTLWFSPYPIFAYLGPLIALLLVWTSRDTVIKVVKVGVYISIPIAIYEVFAHHYLFLVTKDIDGLIVTMDENVLSGIYTFLRAKTFFPGPLAYGQFLIISALILFPKHKTVLVCLIGALLSGSRLAIIAIFIIYIASLLVNKKYGAIGLGFMLCIVIAVIMSILNVVSGQNVGGEYIGRLFNAFNFDNEGNYARLGYWSMGLQLYSNYDLVHQLLGNGGYMQHINGNSAENGYINLLVESGIVGLLFYLCGLFVLLNDLKFKAMLGFIVINIAMMVQVFYMGRVINILLWFFIFYSVLSKNAVHQQARK